MVAASTIKAAAYAVVGEQAPDAQERAAALSRAQALGGGAIASPAPRGLTVTQVLRAARAAVETGRGGLVEVDRLLADVSDRSDLASEVHLLRAAALTREARTSRRLGNVEEAVQRAASALSELSVSLGADPTNTQGLALLDELDELSGRAAIAEELRRMGA